MYELDHIAVTCVDLDRGAQWLSAKLGVPFLQGGQHPRFGTHNRLLGLADGLYLEVIAPDPNAQVAGPRWFDLDNAPAEPCWGNWICRSTDIAAMPALTGPAIAMTRGALNWQITVPADGRLPMQGGFPTLIKWAADANHPAQSLPPSGVRLTQWQIHHPQADELRAQCAMTDPRVHFQTADAVRFVAHFDTPHGAVVI